MAGPRPRTGGRGPFKRMQSGGDTTSKSWDMSTELHVLFGAGQVGQPLARLLLDAGKRVRIARRSPGGVPPGAEVVQGDAADPAFCAEAAQGAATVYHCMNPPYDARLWADVLPRYMDNLIAAAGRTGALLVVLDNVYMLGRPRGRPLDEDTPPNPCSRKGEIRAHVAARLFEDHRRGDVRATAGRASDFYGPRGTLRLLGDQVWRPALAGKRAWVPANPETTRDLVARFSRKLGREIRLARVPRWMVKAIGICVPLVREVDEMLYQWDESFVISDRRFRERFQQEPTAADEAAAATAAWAPQHYATTNRASAAAA